VIPAKAADDATHIAVACVYETDFLLTWNLKPAIPILGIKKRTPGTAILVISGTEMLKNDGLS